MKRLYLTIALLFFCLIIGFIEMGTIRYSTNNCLNGIKKVEYEIENNNFVEAQKNCEKTANEFNNFMEKVVYCYYPHSNIDTINQNLASMVEALKLKDINQYKILSVKTKKQLQAIKDEELFSIQNIL